jgi:hypothetical protein
MIARRPLIAMSALSVFALMCGRAGAVGLDVPLFDAHVHYSENQHSEVPLADALKILDKAGVRMALVSSTSDEGTMLLYRAAPGRVVPELRPYRTRDDMGSWHRDPAIPGHLLERLKLGVHKGIGEFHLHGDEAKSNVVRDVVRIAVERNLVLHAHSDTRAVQGLFAHDARARVLWAHAGFTGPEEVGAMLARYPNLWVETAIRGDIGRGGRLEAGWRDLFVKYQDKILVGTDSYVVSRWRAMPEILGEVRAWLATLPPAVGEKLAWRNGAKLYGIDEGVFTGAAPARK